MSRLAAIRGAQPLLRCPLCHQGMETVGQSLRCGSGHNWDMAARGYVNFITSRRGVAPYDAASFGHRRRFMQAGYYRHVEEALAQALIEAPPGPVVDAGCGEGWFSARLAEGADRQVMALDYAKEAVQRAAGLSGAVCWLVGDIANLPLKDHCAAAVVNAFAPANYAEFARVLRPDGLLVKVIPGVRHLQELRLAARGQLPEGEYSAQPVAEHFARHFADMSRRTVSMTLPLTQEALDDLLRMTPLMFGVDLDAIDRSLLSAITVEAEVLAGRA